ncbi:isoprenylcysteine carboxylmethyltransferase family protein [Nocardia sp. CS682]|uniref:methyltransferase family protein n=1 Tax=Nocardia sp. CS682 TaxID=1047172 RepID=UPI0010750765|nr:isoprenylcysteine carboxylmethyltransferase family protein [Nocardia sp. CS682]QBS39062.1 isoprenylcysteine carboxyl methyltransferase [Nocardia sp. CS682]
MTTTALLIKAHLYGVAMLVPALVLLPWLVIRLVGAYAFEPGPIVRFGGIALATAGFVLGYACVLVFAMRGGGTACPASPPRYLVVDGPYRYLRNPMDAGTIAMVSGLGLALGSWTYLGYAAVLTLALLLWIRHETTALDSTFGPAYRRYRQTTGRWIPRPQRQEGRSPWPRTSP